jgi:hypothetical protein
MIREERKIENVLIEKKTTRKEQQKLMKTGGRT